MTTGWMFCSLGAVTAVAAAAGCADPISADGSACPCPGGYSCRLDDNVCVTTQRIPAPAR
jgi:hypothetical protein